MRRARPQRPPTTHPSPDHHQVDEEFERDFYLRDDDGFGGDEGGATVFMGDDKKFAAREEEMAKQRKFGGAKKQKGMSAMRSQVSGWGVRVYCQASVDFHRLFLSLLASPARA